MEERKCYKCIYCEKCHGSNWGWYCNHKNAIVRGNDYCGYFESK